MLIRCHVTSWLVYIRRPFRLYMMPLMAENKDKEDERSRWSQNYITTSSSFSDVVRVKLFCMWCSTFWPRTKWFLTKQLGEQQMRDRWLQWNMSVFWYSGSIAILLRLFLCNISWFFSKYQLRVSSKVMNSSVKSLESASFLFRVPFRQTNRGPIKPEWISRSYENNTEIHILIPRW